MGRGRRHGAFRRSGRRAEDTVKIGVNAALTGTFVSAGNTIHNAVKLAVKQINDAGGFVVNGKTYKLEPYYRDNRTDVNTAIANARELVDDIGVKAIWGTESHDFSIAMTKITNPAKVIQFTGNSSLGCCLSEDSTKPGGALHYTFQTEPQEFQRSGSTAKGVLTLSRAAARVQAEDVGRVRPGRCGRAVPLVPLCPGAQGERSADRPDQVSAWKQRTSPPCSPGSRRTSPMSCTSGTMATIVMIAYPQAVQLNVAPSYFLFGVDPGVWKERGLKSTVPITLSCVPVCWGAPPFQAAKDYFDQYFALGAPKGVQSSVSLLYYDYVGMFVKAMQEAGTVDDTDKIVAAAGEDEVPGRGVAGSVVFQ